MQDRYVGDAGDYGKYGLLRVLCREDGDKGLKLGINWYLVPDSGNAGDGGFTGYLLSDPHDFKICDVYLYKTLKNIVFPDIGDKSLLLQGEKERKKCPHEGCPGKKGTLECLTRRCTYKVEQRDVLPENTVFYNRRLGFSANSTVQKRKIFRSDWVEKGLGILKSCDIVFFDPDNGLQVNSINCYGKAGAKYVFEDEVARYYKRGQSVIIYQHRSREPEDVYLNRIKKSIIKITGYKDPKAIRLRYRRGTARDFIIVPNCNRPRHLEIIKTKINKMLQTAWHDHFEKYVTR